MSKIFMLCLALAVALTIGAGISNSTEKPLRFSGEVESVFPESGLVVVKDTAGKTISLTAGPGVDLKTCEKGSLITVDYDDKGIILSLVEATRE